MKRLLLAFGATLLLTTAMTTTTLAVDYATVTGYAEGTPANNNPDTWGENCTKLEDIDFGGTYTLTQDYELVVVKAGSEQSAPGHVNTLFADASEGQTVWADSNGSGAYDEGDKQISHIILCTGEPEPTPTPTPESDPTPTPTPVEPTSTPVEPTPTPVEPTPTPVDEPTPTPTGEARVTVPPSDTNPPAAEQSGNNWLPVLVIISVVSAVTATMVGFRRPR